MDIINAAMIVGYYFLSLMALGVSFSFYAILHIAINALFWQENVFQLTEGKRKEIIILILAWLIVASPAILHLLGFQIYYNMADISRHVINIIVLMLPGIYKIWRNEAYAAIALNRVSAFLLFMILTLAAYYGIEQMNNIVINVIT
ncbi:MAG: hypothetical protein AABW72_00940 [archaeon]